MHRKENKVTGIEAIENSSDEPRCIFLNRSCGLCKRIKGVKKNETHSAKTSLLVLFARKKSAPVRSLSLYFNVLQTNITGYVLALKASRHEMMGLFLLYPPQV